MKRWLKRIGVGFGIFLSLLVIGAVMVPFVVDVDDYRPKIVESVRQKMNGKLELGKLSLSLWGQIRVNVAGFHLRDAQGKEIVSAEDVFFHVSFFSIFSGSPVLTLKMQNPKVYVVKDKAGKIDAMTLLKTQSAAPPPSATTSAAPLGPSKNLPAIVEMARLGIEMKNASLSYKDQMSGLVTDVKDLNLTVRDLSLTRPTTLELTANLDTQMKPLVVRGPVRLTARAESEFTGAQFERSKMTLNLDLNQLEILMPGTFEKKKGIIADAQAELAVTSGRTRIEKLNVRFHNAELDGAGTIGYGEPSPYVDLTLKSQEIPLSPWAQLSPMLKTYELGGKVNFGATLKGPFEDLNYAANFVLTGVTTKAPNFKAVPRIDGQIKVVTDRIENLALTLKAPGNELRVGGRMDSFTKPRIELVVNSPGMDLDQLIEFPKPKAGASTLDSDKYEGGVPGKSGAKTAAEDFDAAIDPLRRNKMMGSATGSVKFNVALLKAYGIKMTDVAGTMSLRDLAVDLENFRMGIWGGNIKASGNVRMKPTMPVYRYGVSVEKLDLNQAVASQLELFKNTVVGVAGFKMDGSGASFNPKPAKGNANAKGNFQVDKAIFTTIDVGKMASEAIHKSLGELASKIPPLRGQKLPNAPNVNAKYETITGDLTITGGKFTMPNFLAKAERNQGVDLRGVTVIDLMDNTLQASWEVIDTYNITKARDLSVEASGVRVEHILAEGDGPVKYNVEVSGNMFKPSVNYARVPESLGKVALGNIAKAAEGRVKAELKKKAEEQTKKLTEKAAPQIRDALKGLSKKLFGN